MSNTFDNILIMKSVDIPKQYKNELLKNILKINIFRERILAYILIILDLMLFCLDMLTEIMWGENEQIFIPFSQFHVLLLVVPLFFLISIYLQKRFKSKSIFLLRVLHMLINVIVLVLCSLIGTHNMLMGQQPFCYMIAMFCIAPLILLNPYERFIVYIVPYSIYVIKAITSLDTTNHLIEVIIFSTLLTILALLVSNIIYISYFKNFISNKTIEEKNKQLDNMYRNVEKTLKMRTDELNETIEYEKLRTDFFANISHELRTPLNVIFSAEQMLRLNTVEIEDYEKQKEVSKYMHMMKQNCYRLVRLVDNLIDTTKIDAGYFHINLNNWNIIGVVEEICLSVAKYIEDSDIKLTFDTDVEEKIIMCDVDMIERIMLNLLSNAVKFTPKGGSIYVNIFKKEDSVVISVKDTGIGIPDKMKDFIFEKFIQVDKTSTRKREGSGIGLSIVRSLVEMQNGSISVISEEGKGSEFFIELPDRIIPGAESIDKNTTTVVNQSVEKINIEFSDIYY